MIREAQVQGPEIERGVTKRSAKRPEPGLAIGPGLVSIRPTRGEAERETAAFCELVEAVRRKQGGRTSQSSLTNKSIGEYLGDTSSSVEQNIHKRFKERRFAESDRRAILKVIFDDESLLRGTTRREIGRHADALYFAFLNFVGTRETSQDNARASIVATYKLWRFSVEHDGEFVFGKVVVSEDPETRAVKVEMTQPKKATAGIRGSVERASGYFFRIGNVYLMMLHDPRNEDFRITLFPRFKFDHVGVGPGPDGEGHPRSIYAGWRRHLIHLDGFGLGIDGNSGFFSPVHLSLVDDADELVELDETLDVVPQGSSSIPERVRQKLQRNGPMRRL